MIRRFVNVVAEKYRSNSLYSLHRLDISKHLLYPSTAEAEAAAAEAATLRQLPAASTSSQRSSRAEGASILFALVSPHSSKSNILCYNHKGHCLLYDYDEDSYETMPTLEHLLQSSGRPISVSVARPDALQGDLYVMHPGQGGTSFGVLRFGGNDWIPEYRQLRQYWTWDSLSWFGGAVTSHAVVDGGRAILVSSSGLGDSTRTLGFETLEREWRHAGDWALPFATGAEFVSDLHLCLGFSATSPGHLCAASSLDDRQPGVHQGCTASCHSRCQDASKAAGRKN